MNFRKQQQGFTIVELAIVVVGILAVGVAGTVLYVACHFIAKLW